MATGKQELNLDINADASGLTKATDTAAKALDGLQTDLKSLNSTDAEISVDANTAAAQKQLDGVTSDIKALDGDAAEVKVDADTNAVDRDLANLRKVLDGLERRKVNPDVGLDLVQLLRDEARVTKAIAALEKQKAQIPVELDVSETVSRSVTEVTSAGSLIGTAAASSASTAFGSAFAGAIAGQLSTRLPGVIAENFPNVATIVESKLLGIPRAISNAFSRGAGTEQIIADLDKMDPALAETNSKLVQLAGSLANVRAQASVGGGDAAAGMDELGGSAAGAGVAVRGAGAAMEGAGVSGAAMATGVGAAALAVAGLVTTAWKLGQAAADVETSVTQLDALTGGTGLGPGLFTDLQKWAATTPFAIDDATEAAKKLIAAGVQVPDINDYLNDLGNVASATGVPLSQIATVFAQMESKGKPAFEELQQLAEAGVPVWSTLADKMGLSVAQVQDLATQGKLTADHIDLVRESLNEMFPTAMSDQAETFNGQMSTLQDTLDQTGQSLGTLFLPAMTDLLGLFNAILSPILKGTQKVAEFNQTLEKATGSGLLQFLPFGENIRALELYSDALGDSKGKQDDLAVSGKSASDTIMAGLEDVTEDAAAFQKALKAAEDTLKATIENFGKIGGNIRTRVSFIIDSANLEDDIHKAIKGIPGTKTEKGVPAVSLPVHLTIGQLPDLSDRQQDLFGNIGSFVETQLQEGARRAELNPNFNEDAWFRQVRRKTKGLLIEAGIDPDNAERVLTRIFGLPRTVPVDADVSGAQKDLDAFTPKPVRLPLVLSPQAIDTKDPLMASFTGGGALAPVTAPVQPQVQAPSLAPGATPLPQLTAPRTVMVSPAIDQLGVSATSAALKVLTAARVAHISPVIDPISLAIARGQLDKLAKDRFATIYVNTVSTTPRNTAGGTAPGGGVGALSTPPVGTPQLMAAGRALAAPLAAAGPVPGRGVVPGRAGQPPANAPTRLAPRQTPVQVLLDGAVIADRLDLRRSLAAVQSSRRTA